MPRFSTSRLVRHSPEDMFALVADVEAYPGFVPLCKSLTVRSRETDEEGHEILIAAMTVAYRFIRESFTSRVTLDHGRMTIRAEYLDGPFSHMENVWTFEPADTPDQCQVRFAIDYEFRSRALAVVMGAVFDRAFRRFADAFEQRADAVYGV